LCRMTEKEQADVVLSRKAVFVRCCLKKELGKIDQQISGKY